MAIALRGIRGALVLIAGLLIAAACTPAEQPTPVAAPAKPAEAIPAAKPAATAAPKPVPTPTREPAWKAEWEKTLAAAKQEGKVVIAGDRGVGWRDAAMEFQKAYPDITVEYTGASGRDISPKLLAEREAGLYLWDVYMGGATTPITDLVPNNVMDPLEPALILPDVLDSSKWHQGFRDGFLDLKRQYVYRPQLYLSPSLFVNRGVAPGSQLRRIDNLLEPQWKGKIGWEDPRVPGAGQFHGANLLGAKGEDWVRKLLAQDIVPLRDPRMLVEGLVRGRYAVAIGTRPDERDHFRQEGLFVNVEVLDPDDAAAAAAGGASGHVSLINKAPNPNAAKVFINWLLSKEGQEAFVRNTAVNSRRLDVDGPPETAPQPGVKYFSLDDEENLPIRTRISQVATEMLR